MALISSALNSVSSFFYSAPPIPDQEITLRTSVMEKYKIICELYANLIQLEQKRKENPFYQDVQERGFLKNFTVKYRSNFPQEEYDRMFSIINKKFEELQSVDFINSLQKEPNNSEMIETLGEFVDEYEESREENLRQYPRNSIISIFCPVRSRVSQTNISHKERFDSLCTLFTKMIQLEEKRRDNPFSLSKTRDVWDLQNWDGGDFPPSQKFFILVSNFPEKEYNLQLKALNDELQKLRPLAFIAALPKGPEKDKLMNLGNEFTRLRMTNLKERDKLIRLYNS